MIGLVGVALLANTYMVDPRKVSFWIYWVGLLLAVVAIVVLAMLDLAATRAYFRRAQQAGIAEHAATMKDELLRLKAHQGNGHHKR